MRDAGHLSLLEHGAYRRLIDLYMIGSKPLPFDMPHLYRLLHATSKEEQAAVQVVVEEFFKMDGPVLRHRRCDRELSWQLKLKENQSDRAKIRWENERKVNELHAVAMPPHSHGNAIQNQNQNQRSTPANTFKPSSKGRGSRFTLTAPPDDWISWTSEHFPGTSVERTFASFRDYWIAIPGVKGTKLDWLATWRNWVRRDNPTKGADADAQLVASIENDPRCK